MRPIFFLAALLNFSVFWDFFHSGDERGAFSLFAQETTGEPDPATPDTMAWQGTRETAPALQTSAWFWHDLEIYNWQTRINFQKALAAGWRVEAFEDFASLLQQQSRGDVWKDDHSGGLRLQRQLRWNWEVGVDATSKVFRDDFTGAAGTIGNNDFSLNRLNLRSKMLVWNRFSLAPGLGYRWEDILNRQDNGPHVEFGLRMAPLMWQNYVHNFDLDSQLDDTPERRNEDLNLVYAITRDFENNASDTLFVRFGHLRRDNYFVQSVPASSESGEIATENVFVDVLNRDRRALENRLRYRFSGAGMFLLRSEIAATAIAGSRRGLEPESIYRREVGRFDEQNFEVYHQAHLLLLNDRLIHEFSLDYRSLSRKFETPDSLRVPGFIGRFSREGYNADDWSLTLNHRLRWQIGAQDSLRWYGRATRYAHETANLAAPNDYDRVLFQANLFYEHRFNRSLRMSWEARAYLEHQVYLKRNLSSDNRWTRIWQLLPQITFSPASGFVLKQGFGVRATYIDYDFPETLSRRRSIVLRDFFWSDSLAAALSAAATLELQFKLTLEERGLLNWESWLQSPQTDIQRLWAAASFRLEPAPRWQFAPGVSYYRESNWRFQTQPLAGLQKVFSSRQAIISPIFYLTYSRPPHILLRLSARRQMSFRTLPGVSKLRDRPIDTFNLTLQWEL